MEADNSTPLAAFFKQIYLPTKPSTKPRTVVLYAGTLKSFKVFLGHEPTLADLNNETVGMYLQSKVADGLAIPTVNKDRSHLLAIWNHARLIGAVSIGPMIKKLPEPRKVPKALTVDELKRLQGAFGQLSGKTAGIPNSDFLRACFAIQFTTAERIGAVLALRFDDIRDNVITFHADTRKGGRKSLVKSVPGWVIDDIEVIRRPIRDRIFPISDSNKTKISLLYDRLFKCAGVPRPKGKSSHLLRSTHATMLWLAGGDPTTSLGHASRKVTVKHYLDPRFKPDSSCEHLPPLDDQLEFEVEGDDEFGLGQHLQRFADRLLLPEDVTAEQAPAKLLELFQEKLSDQLQRLNIRVTGGRVDSCEHLPSLDD